MPAELSAHRIANFADFFVKGDFGEFGDHAIFGKKSEIATGFLGAWLFGKLFGKSSEVLTFLGACLCPLSCFQLLIGHILGIFLVNTKKDVAGLDRLRLGELCLVLLVELFRLLLGDLGLA